MGRLSDVKLPSLLIVALSLAFPPAGVQFAIAEDAAEPPPPRSLGDLLEQPDRPKDLKPVPSQAERDAKRKEVLEVFDVAGARTRAEKLEIGEKMYKVALNSQDDPTIQFVLLNMAREMACQAGSLQGAFTAIDQLAVRFDFPAAAVMTDSVAKAAAANVPRDDREDFLVRGVMLVRYLFDADDYERAESVLRVLSKQAATWRHREAIEQIRSLSAQCRRMSALYAEAKPAIERLKSAPDDPAANEAAGRYYAFAKGDWQRGLPLLSKSGNKTLAKAAQAEISKPQRAEAQSALAASWWDLAAVADGLDQQAMQSRAGYWYNKALPGLLGLAKAEAKTRLAQLRDAGVEFEVFALTPGGANEKQLVKSRLVGGGGGGPFADTVTDGYMVVGFYAKYRAGCIKTLQPVYRTANGRLAGVDRGQRGGSSGGGSAIARDGYAVGGVIAKGGNRVDGFRVIFMRIRGYRLDKNDWYASEWLGGRGGGAETLLGGDGNPVVGLHGRSGADLDALGLIQLDLGAPPRR